MIVERGDLWLVSHLPLDDPDRIPTDLRREMALVLGRHLADRLEADGVSVHMTRFNLDEVEEYLPLMAAKYRLPSELVELQWRLLPLVVHGTAAYRRELSRARRDLGDRGPDDAYPLALARTLGLPAVVERPRPARPRRRVLRNGRSAEAGRGRGSERNLIVTPDVPAVAPRPVAGDVVNNETRGTRPTGIRTRRHPPAPAETWDD